MPVFDGSQEKTGAPLPTGSPGKITIQHRLAVLTQLPIGPIYTTHNPYGKIQRVLHRMDSGELHGCWQRRVSNPARSPDLRHLFAVAT
jgi:hypothetical protein